MPPSTSLAECFDVVVIGAGPAGSLTAALLARRGVSVLLVERREMPRYKVCGGCLNERGRATLERAGLQRCIDEAAAVPLNQIQFMRGGRQVTLRGAFGVVVDRARLDASLACAAQVAGADVRMGVTASVEPQIRENRRTVVLRDKDGVIERVRPRLVVAADGLGHNCLRKVSGFLAPAASGSRIGLGVVDGSTVACSAYEIGKLTMAVGDDGYAGVARMGHGALCIAAAAEPSAFRVYGGPAAWLSETLARAGLPPISGLRATAVGCVPALTRRAHRVAGGQIFVLGDAAGYIEPITGEGMAAALVAAERLAPIAAEASLRWHEDWARAWSHELARAVVSRQGPNRWLATALKSPWGRNLAFGLARTAPPLARVLARRINRPARAAG